MFQCPNPGLIFIIGFIEKRKVFRMYVCVLGPLSEKVDVRRRVRGLRN